MLYHLGPLAEIITGLSNKVCSFKDVLAANHDFAEFVTRITGSYVQTAIVPIHLILDVI